MPRNKQYSRLQKENHVFSEKKVQVLEKAYCIFGQEDLTYMPVICKLLYKLNATPRKLSGFSKTRKLIPDFPRKRSKNSREDSEKATKADQSYKILNQRALIIRRIWYWHMTGKIFRAEQKGKKQTQIQ